MADMLTREEVLEQLNSLNTQISNGVGVKAGKSKSQAREDAYAKWIETNRDQIRMADVAVFFGNNPDYGVEEITRDYIDGPGGRGYQYQEAADFGELDFTGEGGRPPVITNTGTFANIDDAFDNMLDRYAQVGNLEDTVDEDGNIVEGIMRPSSFNAADYGRGGKYDYVAPSAAQDFRNLDVTNYGTVGDLISQGKIAKGLFDPQTFNTRDITRGTPAVTRGLDAQGNPTTAITMGDTTATGTGPNIGQLTTDLTFPSTGMGINADGTGTTTTGTLDTTGNIVKLDPDVTGLNLLQSSAGNTSTLDPNAVTGGNVAVNQPTMGLPPSTAPAQPTMPQPVTPQSAKSMAMPPVAAPMPAPVEPTPPSIVQQIAQIVRSAENSLGEGFSEADKAAAINQGKAQIAALGMATPGGISASQIAAGGQLSGASKLLNLDTDATVGSVRDVIGREYQPGFSADTPYMEDEETVYTFNQGGGVTEPANAYEEFTLSVRKGPNDIALEKRQQGVQNLMNSKSGIQPNEKMLSALDRIMGRNNG